MHQTGPIIGSKTPLPHDHHQAGAIPLHRPDRTLQSIPLPSLHQAGPPIHSPFRPPGWLLQHVPPPAGCAFSPPPCPIHPPGRVVQHAVAAGFEGDVVVHEPDLSRCPALAGLDRMIGSSVRLERRGRGTGEGEGYECLSSFLRGSHLYSTRTTLMTPSRLTPPPSPPLPYPPLPFHPVSSLPPPP